jgi:hypothetical protein
MQRTHQIFSAARRCESQASRYFSPSSLPREESLFRNWPIVPLTAVLKESD